MTELTTDHVRIIPLPLSIVVLSSASILLHSCQGLGTTYTIIEINEVDSIAGKGHSGGYPVVAGKHRLNCTEHRDRQLNRMSGENVAAQGQSYSSCRRDRVGRLCFHSLTLRRLCPQVGYVLGEEIG